MTTPLPRLRDLADQLRAAGCVYAEEEAALLVNEARTPEQLDQLLRDRLAGQPLEHVLGWVEFAGHRVSVAPGVFVPRRRTELLVQRALAVLHGRDAAAAPAVVVELCCGAAAISVALLADSPTISVYAVDLDPVAIGCAERNLATENAVVSKGDLYRPLPTELRGRVDLVVASPPYVPSDEIAFMPVEARRYEPAMALDGGPDGLEVARRIVSEASDWLAPAGTLVVEASTRQAAALVESFEACGFGATTASDPAVAGTAVLGQRRLSAVPRPQPVD